MTADQRAPSPAGLTRCGPAALNFVVGLTLALVAHGFLPNVGIGLCPLRGHRPVRLVQSAAVEPLRFKLTHH